MISGDCRPIPSLFRSNSITIVGSDLKVMQTELSYTSISSNLMKKTLPLKDC